MVHVLFPNSASSGAADFWIRPMLQMDVTLFGLDLTVLHVLSSFYWTTDCNPSSVWSCSHRQ